MFTFVCYLPETIFLLNLLVLLLFLTIQDFSNEYKFNLVYFATVSSVWNFILIILLFFNSTGNFLLFWDFLVVTDFLISIKTILFIFSIPLIILSYKYLTNNNLYSYEYFILIQLSIFGLCTLISSNDLITFYLAVEIQSLCFYVLAAIKLYSNFATEAALKYFILGAISSGLLLLGCSFIYGSLGTSNFDELAYLNKFIFTLVSKNEYLYYYDTEA